MSQNHNTDTSPEGVIRNWQAFVDSHTEPISEADRSEDDGKVRSGIYVLDVPVRGLPIRLTEACFAVEELHASDGSLIYRNHTVTYYAGHRAIYNFSCCEEGETTTFSHTIGVHGELLEEVDPQDVARAIGDFYEWEAQNLANKPPVAE